MGEMGVRVSMFGKRALRWGDVLILLKGDGMGWDGMGRGFVRWLGAV